jgi:hypothetical protein
MEYEYRLVRRKRLLGVDMLDEGCQYDIEEEGMYP